MTDPTLPAWSRENDLLFQLRRLREENERLREVQQAVNAADTAILQMLLPKLYSIIDRLLDGQDKALVIEARRVLPKGYKNSFEKEKK